MLGEHPDIHTVSEPWLMLHPVYALQETGYCGEYNANHARAALENFLKNFSGGKSAYFSALRRAFSPMYRQLAEDAGATVFVDKTPRYYLILTELARVFPEAHFILLFRNPLAVLASMMTTWDHRDLLHDLRGRSIDLFRAPHLMLEAQDQLAARASTVSYETLVSEPENALRDLCTQIGLPYENSMLEYGATDQPGWTFGDQEQVYEQKQPVTSSVRKWVRLSSDSQYWRLLSDYLNQLGEETVSRLGYDPESMRTTLEQQRPISRGRGYTFSLDWLLAEERETRFWEHALVSLTISMRREGFAKTARDSVQRIRHFME